MLLKKGVILVIRGIYGYAHHGDLVTHALLQLHQGRHFRDTRCAMRRPEIQYHDLASIVVEGDFAVAVLHSEIRGVCADQAQLGLIIAANADCQNRRQKDRNYDSKGFHPLIITQF